MVGSDSGGCWVESSCCRLRTAIYAICCCLAALLPSHVASMVSLVSSSVHESTYLEHPFPLFGLWKGGDCIFGLQELIHWFGNSREVLDVGSVVAEET